MGISQQILTDWRYSFRSAGNVPSPQPAPAIMRQVCVFCNHRIPVTKLASGVSPLDANDCSLASTRAPSSRSVHTLPPVFGKIRAYRLRHRKCAPVDFHAPSRGKTSRHIRSEPLVPQLAFFIDAIRLSRFVDCPYFNSVYPLPTFAYFDLCASLCRMRLSQITCTRDSTAPAA